MPNVGWTGLLPQLDRESIVPLYRQIYEHLREAILAGTLPESTRLPPERAMADRLSVNRSTIVHAMGTSRISHTTAKLFDRSASD